MGSKSGDEDKKTGKQKMRRKLFDIIMSGAGRCLLQNLFYIFSGNAAYFGNGFIRFSVGSKAEVSDIISRLLFRR